MILILYIIYPGINNLSAKFAVIAS
jgi:hypothetical protein